MLTARSRKNAKPLAFLPLFSPRFLFPTLIVIKRNYWGARAVLRLVRDEDAIRMYIRSSNHEGVLLKRETGNVKDDKA